MPEGTEQMKKDVTVLIFASMTLVDLINEENRERLVDIMADDIMRTGQSRLAGFISSIAPGMVYEAVDRLGQAVIPLEELADRISQVSEEGARRIAEAQED